MASNQLHGKRVEDMIKSSELFAGAADHKRRPSEIFDIEARFDAAEGLPTSIKTVGGSCVGLADATRVWHQNDPHRLLVVCWTQEENRKRFHEVREYRLTTPMLDTLKEGVTPDQVAAVHNELKSFKRGEHVEARAHAAAALAAVGGDSAARAGKIKLNPKIDSKNQRRLQCSVLLEDLDRVCPPVIHREHYGDIVLPFERVSSARVFRQEAAPIDGELPCSTAPSA